MAGIPGASALPALCLLANVQIKGACCARSDVWLDIARVDGFAAFGAGQYAAEVVAAGEVAVQQRRALLAGVMLVSPMHETYHYRIEIETLLCEAILEARWRVLVGDLLENAVIDKVFETFGQDAPCDAEALLEVFEAADAQEGLAQHEQRPAVADDREGPGQ